MIYFINANDPFDNVNPAIDYRVTEFKRKSDGGVVLRDVEQYRPSKRFLLRYTPYEWLSTHSHLFALTKRGISNLVGLRFSQDETVSDQPMYGLDLSRVNASKEQVRLLIDVTLAHLQRLEDFAEDQDLPLLIIWIPPWTAIFEPEHSANAFYVELKATIAESISTPFFDPLDQLAIMTEGYHELMEVYFPDGEPVGHFNEIGNALFADAVAEEVSAFAGRACIRKVVPSASVSPNATTD